MISSEEIHEHLQCSICRDIDVTNISFTPCGHLFCEDCAVKFCSQSIIKCPVCNNEFRITRNVNMVPAYPVRTLLDAIKRKRRDMCAHHECTVTFHCLTCQVDDEVPICNFCVATTHVGHIVLPCNATDAMRSVCEAKLHASRGMDQSEVVLPITPADSDIIEIDVSEEIISPRTSLEEICISSEVNSEVSMDETLPVEWYYAAMMIYRSEHNVYDVPTSYICTLCEHEVHLGSWLSHQRALYERYTLPQSCYNVLHALVVADLLPWSLRDVSDLSEPASKRQRLSDEIDEKFESLMKFALSEGHFCIPQGYTVKLGNKTAFSLSLYLATNLEKLRGDVNFKNRSKFQLFMDAGLLASERKVVSISTVHNSAPPDTSISLETSPVVDVVDEPPIHREAVILFKYWSCGKIYGGLGLVLQWYDLSTTGRGEIFYLVRQYHLPTLDCSVGPVDVLRDIPKESVLLRKVEMLGGMCVSIDTSI